MKKLIIRFGGLVPGYLTEFQTLTCHPIEAQKFETPEDATAAFNSFDYTGTKGVSIRDFETGEFIKSLN